MTTPNEVLKLRRWTAKSLMKWKLSSLEDSRHPDRWWEENGESIMPESDWLPDIIKTGQWLMVVEKMEQLGYSWSVFGVTPISSIQPGILVLFKLGVYPPERNDSDAYYALDQDFCTAILCAARAALEAKS